MATYAQLEDLLSRYEQPIPESSSAVVETRLDEAERLIRATMRAAGLDLEEMITAGRTTADDVTDVICGMVARMLRNPTGAVSQSAGPFSMSVDPVAASGKLWLSREDKLKLGIRRRGGVSVELVDDALPCILRNPTCVDWQQ